VKGNKGHCATGGLSIPTVNVPMHLSHKEIPFGEREESPSSQSADGTVMKSQCVGIAPCAESISQGEEKKKSARDAPIRGPNELALGKKV